jgi:hypothetical protein
MRNAHVLLVGKPEGDRPLLRPSWRWVDNIKMHIVEIEWGGMDLVQDRDKWKDLVKTVMNLQAS